MSLVTVSVTFLKSAQDSLESEPLGKQTSRTEYSYSSEFTLSSNTMAPPPSCVYLPSLTRGLVSIPAIYGPMSLTVGMEVSRVRMSCLEMKPSLSKS